MDATTKAPRATVINELPIRVREAAVPDPKLCDSRECLRQMRRACAVGRRRPTKRRQ